MSSDIIDKGKSNINVDAPIPAVNAGQGNVYFQPGTPGTFHNQHILNNQENGAFVNLVPGNNRSGQMANQLDILTAIGKQLERKTQLPAYSPLNYRNTGGILTPDNNSFNGINFGGALTAKAATTARIADLTAVVVTQDAVVLAHNDLLLIKNGATPSQYAAANAASTANVDLSVTLDGVTVDGVVLANTNRVLLKNQTLSKENGLYLVHTGPALATRVTDMDAANEFVYGASVAVSAGTVNSGKTFLLSAVPTVVGTDPVSFVDLASEAGFLVTHAFDGLYTIGVVAGTAPVTRAPSMDSAAEAAGAVVKVTLGTANGGKTFLQLQTAVTTLGVTPLDFENYQEFLPTALTQPVDEGVENSDTQVYQLP